jgi:PAS domain S-box-containing protein
MEFMVSLARDSEGNPLYLVSVGRDITERKQAEEALRHSEELYRDLVEKISDVIYAVDVGGVLTYVNPAAESLLGLPVEQLVGQSFAQFIHPEDLGRAQSNHQALLSGEVRGPAEYRLLTASGRPRWIRVTSQPIAEEGRVRGLRGVLTDITERKAVEAQLEEEATAAERQRLARELHDSVTQSLHSASLIAETVQLKWEEDPEEGRRGLEHLQQFTKGALAEMRTLLLELNPEALEAQELPALLRQLAQAMMARTRTSVTVTFAGECTVPADVKVALYRIAQEALNNVVKHAAARRVRVNLQCSETRPGQPDKAQTILSIKDDGCGFESESALSSGMGIGIMHERARDIGATLSITSQPDLGTEILVEWQAGQA